MEVFELMRLRHWMTALVCCVMGCASEADPDMDKYAEALARLDSAIERLGAVESAVTTVLSRNRIQLRVPRNEILDGNSASEFVPSDLVARLDTEEQATHLDVALVAMLQHANSGAPIRSLYESGCSGATDSDRVITTLKKDIYKYPVSRQLDAVASIRLVPCAVDSGQQLNSRAATQATNTNSKELWVKAQRDRDEALNKPFQISASDRMAIMDGQVFRFSATEDNDIPVPRHVTRIFELEGARLVTLYRPIAKKSIEGFVFDRYKFASGSKDIQQSPRGWFNALAGEGKVYVSPTFARAAVVACTAKVEYLPSLRARLIATERPWLAERRLTYSDVRGITGMAERNILEMDTCIAQQATFLLAHELAHALVDTQEGKADCLAVSMIRLSGHSEMGIFGSMVFAPLDSPRASILRLSADGAQRLRERRNQIVEFRKIEDKNPNSILSACGAFTFTS